MATLTNLVDRARLELGDLPTKFLFTERADGSSSTYYLNHKPIDSLDLEVKLDDVVQARPVDYIVDEVAGTITFVDSEGQLVVPPLGTTIVVRGTHYRYFSNADFIKFVNTAITQHTHNRTDGFGRQMNVTLLPPVEEYPVAILSIVEGLWALATDAAFDIDIAGPDGVSIPRHQRFAQLTNVIGQRKEQYKELCAQLNVGLSRVEMGTLRRVSRTTNKLVPIYVAQEIDDARRPERVYMQNDLMGRTPLPAVAQVYDIVMTQGDSWSATFDFPDDMEDLEDFTITAQIRTYPQSPTLIGNFYVSVADAENKKISLSLTPDQTKNFPVKAYWDLQFSKYSSGVKVFEQTYVQGLVFTNPRVTDDTIGFSGTTRVLGSVRTVATSNLSLNGHVTVDGVLLADGDRVLVNGQTDKTENGIYIVDSGSWVRSSDLSSDEQFTPGVTVYVDKGATTFGNTGWMYTGTFPAILGTTQITFIKVVNR